MFSIYQRQTTHKRTVTMVTQVLPVSNAILFFIKHIYIYYL